MGTHRRKWDFEEKLIVIRHAEELGVAQALRLHQVAPSTFYKWKEKYDLYGEAGLRRAYHRVDPEIKRLQVENFRLKQLLADKELALQVKDELLKKTTSTRNNGA